MPARHVWAALSFSVPLWLGVGCSREVVPTVAEGKMLYAENGCASCHGQTGRGDGPIAGTLDPKPTNFRDAAAFKSGVEVAALAAVIAKGIAVAASSPAVGAEVPAHHDQGMPPFGHLSDLERSSLALHVMSLRDESQ